MRLTRGTVGDLRNQPAVKIGVIGGSGAPTLGHSYLNASKRNRP